MEITRIKRHTVFLLTLALLLSILPSTVLTAALDEETVTLTAEWYTFDLFYYISDAESTFPPSGYAAGGLAEHYGPSGNDTPFAQIDVNITALKTYTDAVTYIEGSYGNQWHFEPLIEQDLDSAKAFWAAVLECCTPESIRVLKATTLYDDFVGYCLKNQSAAGDYHIDGILTQEPPVYVVELHEDGEYMGGLINGAAGPFPTMVDVLNMLEGYWSHTITWTEDENGSPIPNSDGNYTGTYIIQSGNTTTVYDVTVEELNQDVATTVVEGTDIKYQEVGYYYYLAQFEIHTAVSSHTVSYMVTYTDGVETEDIFHDHEYGVNEGEVAPAFTGSTDRSGYTFEGWLLESDGQLYTDADIAQMTASSDMVFHAVWSWQVVFHASNTLANGGEDVFRVYYSSSATLPEDEPAYPLNTDGTVPSFYELPEFDYETHNEYIFQGWYLADGTPLDWSTATAGDTHLYAQWFETGDVSQEDDGKSLPSDWNGAYPGFELTGLQIRTAENDPADYNSTHGTAGGGLRFITVLKEELYDQINALPGNEGGAEYGFVMAKRSALDAHTTGDDYRLEYKDSNVNGKDTTTDYSYVINLKCSGHTDHFNGVAYRLYTGVVTYKSAAAQGDDALAAAHASDMTARSYIRYYDANGLYRTYYNNYTGTSNTAGGCSASYDSVLALLQGE